MATQTVEVEVTTGPVVVDVTLDSGPVEVEVRRTSDVEVVATGTVGLPGPQGPAGADGDAFHVYDQSTPSATWVIPHPLNKKPSVTVVDSLDRVMVGEVHYDSLDQVTVFFDAEFSGKAYLN